MPEGYICHRCNKTGHWINFCPEAQTDSFDYRRIKKATGIPSAFLKKVEVREGEEPEAGTVRLADGTFALMTANDDGFDEKAAAAQRPPAPEASLECPICKRLLRHAVQAPCCKASVCSDCITTALADDMRMRCPVCNVPNVSVDSLVPMFDVRRSATLPCRMWLLTVFPLSITLFTFLSSFVLTSFPSLSLSDAYGG